MWPNRQYSLFGQYRIVHAGGGFIAIYKAGFGDLITFSSIETLSFMTAVGALAIESMFIFLRHRNDERQRARYSQRGFPID
jgi:hypothetical protein